MRYQVLTGLNYDPRGKRAGDLDRQEKRAEIGDVVDDLPEMSIPWLLKQGLIEPYGGPEKWPS